MKQFKKTPFLLGVTLYGLMVLLVLMLLGLVLVLINVNQFSFLHENYSLQSSNYGSITLVYLPLLFIVISIYTVIQLLRKRNHARYIFIFLSAILIGFLIWQKPIDTLNILFIILINVIILMHPSWFKIKPSELDENRSEIEEE